MIAADLKTYRLSTGRNLRQFGEYLGVTPQCISNWELSKCPIPTIALKLIYALEMIEQIRQPKLPLPISEHLCKCGCGLPVEVNWRSDKSKNWEKGKYRDYIKGHNA